MKLLLDHSDSPYIRAIGFLYLRFVGDPKTVWDWIEPYLYDTESLTVTATANKISHGSNSSSRRQQQQHVQRDPQTVGDFVKRLFSSDRDYYGTMLPRLPIQIERDLQVKLLLAEQIQDRADKHLANRMTMDYFQTLGSRVMALYGDDDNPVQWYEAVIDRVITRNEDTSHPLTAPKFVVTFPQYGNTEIVSLGEMEMCGVSLDDESFKTTKPLTSYRGGSEGRSRHEVENRGRDRDHDRDRNDKYSRDEIHNRPHNNSSGFPNRGNREESWSNRGGRNGSPGASSSFRGSVGGGQHLATESDLYEEVRRRERNIVIASGNHAIARRTPTTSARFEVPTYRDTERRRSPLPADIAITSDTRQDLNPPDSHAPAAKKRSAEEFAAIQEKKRKLIAKYG
jgi:pre-mRNA-splicing factor 38B